MKNVVWLLTLALLVAGMANSAAQTEIKDPGTQVSLVAPDGWIGLSRSGFVSIRQEEADGRPRYLAMVLVEDLVGQRVRIDQYKRIVYEAHYEQYGAPERWVQRDTTFSGLPAYVVDFSYPYGGDGEQIHVRRIVAFKDRVAYIISAESRLEYWQELLEHFNKILASAKIPS
jgi:hypothetical protein